MTQGAIRRGGCAGNADGELEDWIKNVYLDHDSHEKERKQIAHPASTAAQLKGPPLRSTWGISPQGLARCQEPAGAAGLRGPVVPSHWLKCMSALTEYREHHGDRKWDLSLDMGHTACFQCTRSTFTRRVMRMPLQTYPAWHVTWQRKAAREPLGLLLCLTFLLAASRRQPLFCSKLKEKEETLGCWRFLSLRFLSKNGEVFNCMTSMSSTKSYDDVKKLTFRVERKRAASSWTSNFTFHMPKHQH